MALARTSARQFALVLSWAEFNRKEIPEQAADVLIMNDESRVRAGRAGGPPGGAAVCIFAGEGGSWATLPPPLSL